MVDPALVEQATHLPVDQQLELIEALRDSVASAGVPLSPETAARIDERVADARANPSQSRPWDEFMDELDARHPG